MKKEVIVPLVIAGVLVVGIGSLLVVANNAKPGDALYALDRTSEAAVLSVKKTFSKLSYAKYNLQLATERTHEMKDLKKTTTAASPFVKRVFAQSTNLQKLNEKITILLADITKNLTEAQAVLETLPESQKQELSLEIADKTTEVGNELSDVAESLDAENVKKLTEVASTLETIDTSALDALTNSTDENPSDETEVEKHVAETLQNKLETKLLKLREKARIYTERMDTNKGVLSAANVTKATALIAEITSDLATAETQLGAQDFKAVADILDTTADKIDELKDLVKVDGNEDVPDLGDGSDSTDDENEDTNDDQDEDHTPTPSGTTGTPKPSKTPEPSEKPEPTEKPEPSEKPEASEKPEPTEEPEDVQGAQTQPSSNLAVVRNSLRF